MAQKASNDSGYIINLDGKEYELQVTAGAAMQIENLYGNIRDTFKIITAIKPSDYLRIINIGLGKEPLDTELREAIFRTGYINLTNPLTEFITLVCVGGSVNKKKMEKKVKDSAGEKSA